jgi:hypothetical protein
MALDKEREREVKIKDVVSMCIASKGYKCCPHKMSKATLVRRRKKIGIDSMAILSPLLTFLLSSSFESGASPLLDLLSHSLSHNEQAHKIVCYFTTNYFQGKRKKRGDLCRRQSRISRQAEEYFILRRKI